SICVTKDLFRSGTQNKPLDSLAPVSSYNEQLRLLLTHDGSQLFPNFALADNKFMLQTREIPAFDKLSLQTCSVPLGRIRRHFKRVCPCDREPDGGNYVRHVEPGVEVTRDADRVTQQLKGRFREINCNQDRFQVCAYGLRACRHFYFLEESEA